MDSLIDMTWNKIKTTPLPEPISNWYRMSHDTRGEGYFLLFGYDAINFEPKYIVEVDYIIQEKMIDGCVDNLKITHWMHIDTKELI